MIFKHTPTQEYDDLIPVSIMGDDLLDRHNDRIAIFEKTFEEREKILRAVNSHEGLVVALRKSIKMLEQLRDGAECDHAVGVCWCDYWRLAEENAGAIAQAEEA